MSDGQALPATFRGRAAREIFTDRSLDGLAAMSNYHYTGCGLDYVYLENGYIVHDTPYGEGVSIEHADELHRVIANWIVQQRHTLRGQEVRFLRSLLDLSQAGLGEVLGVSRPTVARWEAAADQAIAASSDRALRLFYSLTEDDHALATRVRDLLREIDELQFAMSVFELASEPPERWVAKAA